MNVKINCELCGKELDVKKSYEEETYFCAPSRHAGVTFFVVVNKCECGNLNCMQFDNEETKEILNRMVKLIAEARFAKKEKDKVRITKNLHRLDSELTKKRGELKERYSGLYALTKSEQTVLLGFKDAKM